MPLNDPEIFLAVSNREEISTSKDKMWLQEVNEVMVQLLFSSR